MLHQRFSEVSYEDIYTHSQSNGQALRPYLAVIADSQLEGRGTQGRKWEGGGDRVGNLYLTVCIPYREIPVQMTLLPLQIAVLVAERAARVLEACRLSSSRPKADSAQYESPKVTVKWPNDVFINDGKLSGTLIESEIVQGTTWFLIGIGVNIAYAPDLAQSPGKSVRPATCLQEHCPEQILPQTTAVAFGSDLVKGLVDWIQDKSDKAQQEQIVIDRWKSFAEFGKKYEIRGDVDMEDSGKYVGETVTTVDIQNDGQLVVRGENGRQRLLIADYLF